MGATNIHVTMSKKRFKTAREAFGQAVEDAIDESGHDAYNGTISTCDLVGKINEPKNDEEYDLKLDEVGKRECVVYETKDNFVFIGWASC